MGIASAATIGNIAKSRSKSKSTVRGRKDVVRRGVHDWGRSCRCTPLRIRGPQHKSVYSSQGQFEESTTPSRKEPRRIGNPPLSFTEYRREHGGCWVCYGKGCFNKHDHKMCKVYEDNKRAYLAAHPENVPKEKQIVEWKKRQADAGQHV